MPGNGPVYVWVRYYKRRMDKSPGRLEVSGQALSFADASGDQLNRWVWERVGPWAVAPGEHNWSLTRRPLSEDPHRWSLFVDVLVFTTDEAYTPGSDVPWQPLPERRYPLSQPASSGEITVALAAPGFYQCRVAVESEQPLVDAFGRTPVSSNTVKATLLQR